MSWPNWEYPSACLPKWLLELGRGGWVGRLWQMTDLIMPHNLARQRVVSACGYYYSYVMLFVCCLACIFRGPSVGYRVPHICMIVMFVFLLMWFKTWYVAIAVCKDMRCVCYCVLRYADIFAKTVACPPTHGFDEPFWTSHGSCCWCCPYA